ncbi:MAG: GAF and ANTAR domain-containing protein [Ilumatobacteraceae bacterium]
MSSEDVRLAEMFGSIARELMAVPDPRETLAKVVELALEHLDGCESVGVSMVEGRKVSSPVSAGDLAAPLDALQSRVDEGPCLDALREQQVFLTGDVRHEVRWPLFSARAHAETGVSSILAVRLFMDEDTLGALNMYSTQPDAFDEQAVAVGAIFATHAAVALVSARREVNLGLKADSRDLIGRAKGILMSQRRVTDADAFALLRAASQELNRKLVDIASDVDRTGELPT